MLSVNFVVPLSAGWPSQSTATPLGFVVPPCLWPRRRPQLAQPAPAPAGGHPALAPLGHPPPALRNCSQARLPSPRPSPRATALRRARVRSRNPDVPIAPGALPWEPLGPLQPRPYPPSAGVRGVASSCGHLPRDGLRLCSGSCRLLGGGGCGEARGGKEGAGGLGGGVFRLRTDGAGGMRCEMRRAEQSGQRAGGRSENRGLRVPPAPSALSSRAWRAGPSLVTSAGLFVCWHCLFISGI